MKEKTEPNHTMLPLGVVTMNQLYILLAVLSVSLAAPSHEANSSFSRFFPDNGGGRIVGGVQADIKDLPWQAALLRNGGQSCGGAIISHDTILTAAHCVAPSRIWNINMLSFRVGSSQWRSGGQVIFARQIIVHELYQDCDRCSLDYDIAVVKLQESIRVQNAVPIALAPANRVYNAGAYAIISGWGTLNSGDLVGVETLRRTDVPTVDVNRCRSIYGSIISERTICAGYTAGGKDSCQGDSGGPFVINGELAGVVSFGNGCAFANFPGVYASVPGYRTWIRTHSGI